MEKEFIQNQENQKPPVEDIDVDGEEETVRNIFFSITKFVIITGGEKKN